MQTFKNYSKYFIITALTFSIVGGVFAQVSIPTGLTNAIQYIMQTVWTDDGTDSGLVNVQIDDTNIYVRTGFLADGTGWNNKALGLDSSGNVVYVDAAGVPQLFSLSPHVIPKLNTAGDNLEASIMIQNGNLLGINTLNPLYTVDIMSSISNAFRVQIPGGNQTFTYDFIGSNTGFSSGNPFSFPAPLGQFACSCDQLPLGSDCGNQFPTTALEGPGTPSFDYCFDYVEVSSTPGLYNYNIYTLTTVVGGQDIVRVEDTSISMGSGANASGINSFMRNDGSVVHPGGILTILNRTVNVPGINGSAHDNEFMVNSEKVVIGNIENSNLFYRWNYINGGADTYLPGFVMADQFGAMDIGAINGGFSQSLTLGNNPVLTSDSRFKTGVVTINGALNVINGLNPVQFQWAENEYTENMNRDPSVINYGLIAQDVQGVLPTLVEEIPDTFFKYEGNKEGGDFLGVKYTEIIPILIQAIKEQQVLIGELRADVTALQQQ